ncbi:MAG: PDZ domain-containing protein [Polyangiaceae bacterium]
MLKRSDLVHLAEALGGLPVYGCLRGSPAERAGVRYGDVVLSVDGQATPTWDAYLAARERSANSIHLRLFRDGSELEVDVPLDRVTGYDAGSLASALGLLDEQPGEVN